MLAVTIVDGGFVGFSAAAFFFTGALYFILSVFVMIMGFPRRARP